jgi:hypothetical protein
MVFYGVNDGIFTITLANIAKREINEFIAF